MTAHPTRDRTPALSDEGVRFYRGLTNAALISCAIWAVPVALAAGVSPQRLATVALQLLLAGGAVLIAAGIVRAERGRR